MKVWHLSFCNGFGHNSKSHHLYAENSKPSPEEIQEKFYDWYGGDPILFSVEHYTRLELVKVNKKT